MAGQLATPNSEESDLVESDPIDADLEHRLWRIAEFENGVLRMVVNVKVTSLPVVPISFDRGRVNL